ncbi:hypothetical protein RDI58_025723 [Solanum bulbocastanum]|uniref:Uncharacterized protein n=1 Tax=Solanum bulbocastanum TaxID=147425 RepID=A0AAN8Y446_SOLBU
MRFFRFRIRSQISTH